MDYRATRDSFNGRYFVKDRVYSFEGEPPSKWFVPLHEAVPTEKVTEVTEEVDEKRELVDEAKALGIDVDNRWGVKKLKAAIAAEEITSEET